MTRATNGKSAAIVRFVAAHPGCTRAEILAGLGISGCASLLTQCADLGKIHRAGPRHGARYYPTRAEAEAVHDGMVREAARRRKEREKRHAREYAVRKRVARILAGKMPRESASGRMLFAMPQGVTLAPDVRITIAKPMPDRWAE